VTRPKGPHGDAGDGGDGADGGVPRPRDGHGRPTATIAEGHEAIADAATRGRPGGESAQPRNDPKLGKHDEQTVAEIEKARNQIAPKLQQMADDAWDHVDQNKDAILAQEGYQRRREKLLERGYPEETVDLILERTALGTEAHTHFARSIDAEAQNMLPPETGFRLRTEVGYDAQGVETSRQKDQDFRPDVILERQYEDAATGDLDWEVAHAYDLKTGLKTGIEPGWANKVQDKLDLGRPPEEIRPTQRPLSVD
jgi:hypothetical protein